MASTSAPSGSCTASFEGTAAAPSASVTGDRDGMVAAAAAAASEILSETALPFPAAPEGFSPAACRPERRWP